MWFKLWHNPETGWPYLGKRTSEVDKYDINPDNAPSEPQLDIDKDLKQEEQRDITAIQQSPINAPPMLHIPFRHMTMSQTTMAPTIAVQTTMTGMAYDLRQTIKQAWNKGMKRNPGGGGPGGNPGGGGGWWWPLSSQGLPLIPQQVPQPQGDIRMMGGLPEPFTSDCKKARHFIEAMKTYISLNWQVPGFKSAMQKINLTHTLMHGEKVAGWVKSVGAALDELDPTLDNANICGWHSWKNLPNSI